MTFDKERCRRLFSRFSSATRRPVEPLVSAVVVAATVKRKSGARSGKVQSVLEKEGEGDTQKHITARLSAADGAAAAAEERGRRSCVNQVTGQLSPVPHLHHLLLLLLVLCSSERET